MNVWDCRHTGCKRECVGTGGAAGLRAIGWFFRKGSAGTGGPMTLCPEHHPDGFTGAEAEARAAQAAITGEPPLRMSPSTPLDHVLRAAGLPTVPERHLPWSWTSLNRLAAHSQAVADVAQRCADSRKGNADPTPADIVRYEEGCVSLQLALNQGPTLRELRRDHQPPPRSPLGSLGSPHPAEAP